MRGRIRTFVSLYVVAHIHFRAVPNFQRPCGGGEAQGLSLLLKFR